MLGHGSWGDPGHSHFLFPFEVRALFPWEHTPVDFLVSLGSFTAHLLCQLLSFALMSSVFLRKELPAVEMKIVAPKLSHVHKEPHAHPRALTPESVRLTDISPLHLPTFAGC